jgi:hypothetical protein
MRDYMLPPAEKMVGIEAHFLGQYLAVGLAAQRASRAPPACARRSPCEANWWEHENLDNAQTGLHDHLMYRKYGFGRGAAQISVDVRSYKLWSNRKCEMPKCWRAKTNSQAPTAIGMRRIGLIFTGGKG